MNAFILRYALERLPIGVFGPTIFGLALVAAWVAHAVTPRGIIGSAWLLVAFVVQFRLWDDLEDRERDARSHPDRVVVRSDPGTVQRWVVAIGLLALALAWALGGVPALLSALALDVTFLALYRTVRAHVTDGLWRFGLLPMKYPAFVAIAATSVGTPAAPRLAIAVVAAFLVASGHEFWHTRPTPALGDIP